MASGGHALDPTESRMGAAPDSRYNLLKIHDVSRVDYRPTGSVYRIHFHCRMDRHLPRMHSFHSANIKAVRRFELYEKFRGQNPSKPSFHRLITTCCD